MSRFVITGYINDWVSGCGVMCRKLREIWALMHTVTPTTKGSLPLASRTDDLKVPSNEREGHDM